MLFSWHTVTYDSVIYPQISYKNSWSNTNTSKLEICHTRQNMISNSPNSSDSILRSLMKCKFIIRGFTLQYLSGNFTSFTAVTLSDPVLMFPSSLKFSRRNFKSRAVPHWIISLRTERRGFPSNCRICKCGRKPKALGNLDKEEENYH
jgi:hypothetical protein